MASLQQITDDLAAATRALRFSSPVAATYHPLDYASALVSQYLARFGKGKKRYVLLGMNPGPFGMGQTGVPFGEVAVVRDWMKLSGEVARPKNEHPKRPVLGLACTRSEVSGKRLWGAIANRYPDPKDFFAKGFVVNYCPLLFLSETGSNVTPDKLKKNERARAEEICDQHLSKTIAALGTEVAIGVGQYATDRLEKVLGDRVQIATIPHPSPASPLANRGWEELAKKALANAGIADLL